MSPPGAAFAANADAEPKFCERRAVNTAPAFPWFVVNPVHDDRLAVLVTGANGHVGRLLRAGLRDRFALRLTDVRQSPAEQLPDTDHVELADLTDRAAAARLVECVDAIVHVAGESRAGAEWQALSNNNLDATNNLLKAAHVAGVRKVVYASSVHAAGGYNDPAIWPVDPDWPARPCCLYGVSKVGCEAMTRLYGDTHPGSSVISLRLALVDTQPRWRPEVAGWLSAEDLVELVAAALTTSVAYGVFFGASRSPKPRYDLAKNESVLRFSPGALAPNAEELTTDRPDYSDQCVLWPVDRRF